MKKTKSGYVKRKKPSYSAAEKRAYWAGVGFQSRDNGLNSTSVNFLMSDKCKESFVNGRQKADSLTSKFISDLFTEKTRTRTNKNKRIEKR